MLHVGMVRYDRASYRKAKKLANGYLRADAHLTRVGVFEYVLADGTTRRELRLPEEVFHPDALESFALAPVTREHPPEALTAENTATFQVGVVGENPRQDGELVSASILVTHADAVADLEGGVRKELSCGYNCELEMTPGTWNGQRYDAIQRRIRGNHVALVSRGRAGPEVRVRLDSDDAIQRDPAEPNTDTTPPTGQEHDMKKVLINGIWVEVSEQAAQALEVERQRVDSELAALKAGALTATAKADKEAARADALAADLEKEKTARADAADPKRVRALVAERVALERQAVEVLGDDFKLDALDDAGVRLAMLTKLCPEVKLEGKSADYINARLDAAVEAFRKDAAEEPHARVRRAVEGEPGADSREDEQDPELAWRDYSRNAWKQKPLGAAAK